MIFNLNESVKVQLTNFGFEIYKEYLKKYKMEPKIKAEHKFQLWELMQIFGPHLQLGMHEVPFVGCDIIIEDKKNG